MNDGGNYGMKNELLNKKRKGQDNTKNENEKLNEDIKEDDKDDDNNFENEFDKLCDDDDDFY